MKERTNMSQEHTAGQKHPVNREEVKVLCRLKGQEDLLEKGMATHSSILAWRIPWTEALAGYSPWGHKES